MRNIVIAVIATCVITTITVLLIEWFLFSSLILWGF